jgi:hypothetical protein
VQFTDSVAGLGETRYINDEGKEVVEKNKYGLRSEYSFRPGEVAVIDAELAEKWIAGDICELAAPEAPIARPSLHY